ncbi:MAG: Undecaprenyl-phosphate 4-deoxy-4-formamido-L-arabinose transferase [Verrucomicrobiae bacterium]|nr:Undecaprenyl-phosphate 4-deoxy-4-formamido-L-arabinose transferase [Verrucomicrobiae bacterium]
MSNEQIDVSVVIPCLNEVKSIAFCIDKALKAFQEAGIKGEVVIGDNGSTDGSIEIAEKHGARVAHATLKGYGHALRAAIEAARGTFLIMGDADDSYDFTEVPRFVAKWHEGYEVVMGNRFKGEIKPGAMPWHHKYIGNPVLSTLLRVLFNTSISDSHCGMRGFTKDSYIKMDLRTTGMEFASEFVIKAVKIGAKMTEIPITLWPDKRGRPPHLRSFRDGWRHLRFMLLYAPNWLFLVPGGVLMGLGLFLVFWLLAGPRYIGQTMFDYHSMFFGVIFTLLGAQIISIGLFAKIFSHSERFAATEHGLERWLKRLTFEHGLVGGGLLALIGFAGDMWIFCQWAGSGFGALAEIRAIMFWSLWFFLGLQVVFASFFLSMLGISRGTYIGDYELKGQGQ